MRISSLRLFLQSLCCNSPWNYAAFWKLKYQPEIYEGQLVLLWHFLYLLPYPVLSKNIANNSSTQVLRRPSCPFPCGCSQKLHSTGWVLTWEDSFCDITKQRDSLVPLENFYFDSLDDVLSPNFNSRLLDGSLDEYPIGLAVAEMSSASHVFGKGVVGVAAFTGVPRWIYSDNIAADVFDSVFVAEYDEWLLQFVAGIKTILLLPVIPHGVLQLGSVKMVAEDAKLVSFVRQNFESYKRSDGYDAVSPIQKVSPMPTDLENLEEPSIVTTNGRNDDHETIHSNISEACNILIADQMVPAFMVQDFCNPFIAGLANSCGNLIVKDVNLQSLGRLKCDDDKFEVSESVLFKPRLNEKARAFPLSDNFQWMKHGECVNELGDFYFEEGPIEQNAFSNNFVYDSETGGTLLNLPSEYELQKAFGSAVVGPSDHIHDSLISGHNALWTSINDRDFTCWMELSGVECAASTQKDDEMEHLLETVVADAYSSTNDNSPNQLNPATAIKMSPGKVFASSPKTCNILKRNALGEGNTSPFSFFTSAFNDTGKNTVSGLSPSASSSESTMTALIDKQQQQRKGNHFVNQRKGSRLSSIRKRNSCTANDQGPRPRDRQLIQDRMKELRDLVPNSDKCSIDGLLDKTIKHMLFLRDVTNQADKLRHQVLKEETNHNTAITAEVNRVHQNGTSWAVELGNEHHQCPIIVKDLDNPGQMLIEMLCTDHGRFLEIADAIQRLQLTILKAVMEKCSEKSWAHFIVEATGSFQRLDIFWPLMQLLQHPMPIGIKTSI